MRLPQFGIIAHGTVDVLNALLLTLAAEPAPTAETIDRLKAEARTTQWQRSLTRWWI